jgi:hypothetical protein
MWLSWTVTWPRASARTSRPRAEKYHASKSPEKTRRRPKDCISTLATGLSSSSETGYQTDSSFSTNGLGVDRHLVRYRGTTLAVTDKVLTAFLMGSEAREP